MNGIDAIRATLDSTKATLEWFVSDLSDADLLVRPVAGANHIAWQIGNVIGGDIFLVEAEFPDAAYPKLPDGFAERHGSKFADHDGSDGLLTKAEYLKLLTETRAATVAVLETLTDADLDRPTGEGLRGFAPTVGRLFLMVAEHTLWHAGQFSVVRRKLGRPVLI